MTGRIFGKSLSVNATPIDGMMLVELPVHGDNRGWFKENWQREKMHAAGLADFGPVQQNVSFNESAGTTRGIHAEPWDKLVSVAAGCVFGAWVDLRRGPGFGTVFTAELNPSTAVFVPRGVGNAFQTLQDGTVYSYLVNEHWSPDAGYTFLNLADPTAAIAWPIPLARAELSEKDRTHPWLSEVEPMRPLKTLVLGAGGQLGRALGRIFDGDPDVEFLSRTELDLARPEPFAELDFRRYGTIVNAAAYTGVDSAETLPGRAAAWAVNAGSVAKLARHCTEHRITLVHISSDYVFDGSVREHGEDEPFSPLGVYGQSKAAGDAAVSTVPAHYIVRTSWVVGEGKNFVATMAALAQKGVSPRVVSDQQGRLSFTQDIAAAIKHLLVSKAPYGCYNVSNDGPIQSWADIAGDVFAHLGRPAGDVTAVTSKEYASGQSGPAAPRPPSSVLNLAKIRAAGFTPPPAAARLAEYLSRFAGST